jgi:thioredoxin 1
MASIFEITRPEQLQEILQAYTTVILDVYADWCSPCKMIAPKFATLAQQYQSNQVLFCKANVETRLFEVRGLPTFQIYHKGAEYHTVLGANIDEVEETLQKLQLPKRPISHASSSEGSTAQMGAPAPTAYKPKGRESLYKTYGTYSKN